MISIEDAELPREMIENRINDTEKQIERFENFIESLKLRKKKYEEKLSEMDGE
ncbi:hypothetical protein [Methanococcus maripaludis]|uniref:Uncharacterized protein n=1 Tax=Methanococcus maripaludis (strain DSM 14266 / JCM 13030 / NBRC 101832 / S2 / LL) TaxID=267377 RepID=Q6LZ84_METMP|nr:hypothetical protein [Methanococcus maripaludis]CAF30301.1 hypothetical protein MMP0745 [Methanococcus maripaludis S2]